MIEQQQATRGLNQVWTNLEERMHRSCVILQHDCRRGFARGNAFINKSMRQCTRKLPIRHWPPHAQFRTVSVDEFFIHFGQSMPAIHTPDYFKGQTMCSEQFYQWARTLRIFET
ncbi:hypothetical protein MCRY_19075 [Marivita cryptomonadis]|nr:hypothetical protein MCRY_19075 [Marivita cryptomonadis]